jgi:hypothetical protein
MSDYRSSILARLGTGVIEASFDDIPLKPGNPEKGTKAEVLPRHLAGEKMHVRKLPAKVYEKYLFGRMDTKTREMDFNKYPGMRAELVSLCITNPDGEPLFKDTDDANNALTNDNLKWCFDLCQWVNGADTGAQEEAEKN